MPARATDAPPGFYMLFVIDDQRRAVGRQDRARQHRREPRSSQLDYTPIDRRRGRHAVPAVLQRGRDAGRRLRQLGRHLRQSSRRDLRAQVDQVGALDRRTGATRVHRARRPAPPNTRTCPRDFAISGFRGRAAQYVDQLDFECRALTASGLAHGRRHSTSVLSGGTGGTAQGPFSCSTGNPVYALTGRSGGWLDAFGVLCRQAPITNTDVNTRRCANPGKQSAASGWR